MRATEDFVGLAEGAGERLRRLLRRGGRVEAEALAGATWLGWNGSALFGVIGQRKFFKRVSAPDASGRIRGENVLAGSGGLREPWRARFGAKGILPFAVLAPGTGPVTGAPDQAAVISYGAVRSRLNPLGLLVDHVVRPYEHRPDLLLGESVLLLPGGRTLFIEHFVLERGD